MVLLIKKRPPGSEEKTITFPPEAVAGLAVGVPNDPAFPPLIPVISTYMIVKNIHYY